MNLKNQRTFISLLISLICLYTGLIVYSYTQVDLNLTLSQNSIYLTIQKDLTQIGFYQRDLSANIFFALIIGLFINYLVIFIAVKKKLISTRQLIIFIIFSLFLILSYPAFSHDIFNYMFDARIVTKYGLDPNYFRALDFPDDTWTRFMRWTHRYYPYGPLWLVISLVPSLMGFGKFVLTLIFFKCMFAFFHMANLFFIRLISKKTNLINANLAVAFYAFNPLVIIESLVSPHNEVLMLTFTLIAIYFFVLNKKFFLIISLLLSAGIKFISFVLLPMLLIKREYKWQLFILAAILLWSVALVPIILQREPYSWYLIPIMALGSLLSNRRSIMALFSSLSLGLLVRYWPYLKFGTYNSEVNSLQSMMFFLTVSSSFVITFWILRNFNSKS